MKFPYGISYFDKIIPYLVLQWDFSCVDPTGSAGETAEGRLILKIPNLVIRGMYLICLNQFKEENL